MSGVPRYLYSHHHTSRYKVNVRSAAADILVIQSLVSYCDCLVVSARVTGMLGMWHSCAKGVLCERGKRGGGWEEDGPYDIHFAKCGSKQLRFAQPTMGDFGIPTFRTSHRVRIPVVAGVRPLCGCCFLFVCSRRCPKRRFACVAFKKLYNFENS